MTNLDMQVNDRNGSLSESRLLAKNPLKRLGRFRDRASPLVMAGGEWFAE
jgi:hypothetical protein